MKILLYGSDVVVVGRSMLRKIKETKLSAGKYYFEDSIEGTYNCRTVRYLDDKTLSEVFLEESEDLSFRMVDRRSGYFYRSGLSCADHDGT